MKKQILFTIIGAVILFVWQFLSWAVTDIHKSANEYTPKQDEILAKLDELGLEEGMYFLGQPDPALSKEEQEAAYADMAGKSWAVINYQKNMSMDMVMPMIRGFLVNLVIAWMLFWMFRQQKDPTLMNRLYMAGFAGIIVFLTIPYIGYIWYREPDIWAYLLDCLVPFIIIGFIGHKMAKD